MADGAGEAAAAVLLLEHVTQERACVRGAGHEADLRGAGEVLVFLHGASSRADCTAALRYDVDMARRGKIIPFPTRTPVPPPADERTLVELHRCDQAEAVVVKSLLESEGIPTVLRSRIALSVHPFSVGSQGEVVVLVPESELPRSRGLLGRL